MLLLYIIERFNYQEQHKTMVAEQGIKDQNP